MTKDRTRYSTTFKISTVNRVSGGAYDYAHPFSYLAPTELGNTFNTHNDIHSL